MKRTPLSSTRAAIVPEKAAMESTLMKPGSTGKALSFALKHIALKRHHKKLDLLKKVPHTVSMENTVLNTISILDASRKDAPRFVAALGDSDSTAIGNSASEAVGRLILKHPRRFCLKITGKRK